MKNIESSELFKIIGKNIKYYRQLYSLEKEKMTQEKLAELADVSIALIGNLESEKINQGLSVFTLWKISRALEIPIENLFNGVDNNKKSIRSLIKKSYNYIYRTF